ncbi:hypothetical protein SPLC1_S051080 [Arthrospira platensis C1]|nr:hypothetical protein SPLC1_S051080 [Arthrospira platensis C1]
MLAGVLGQQLNKKLVSSIAVMPNYLAGNSTHTQGQSH